MDAKEFVVNLHRLCGMYVNCHGCPLEHIEHNCAGDIDDTVADFIETWAKEHPIMTNRMKFKEVFGVDVISYEKGFRPVGVIPEMKYLIEWLNAEYKENKDA